MACWYAMHANKLSHILPVHKPHKSLPCAFKSRKRRKKLKTFTVDKTLAINKLFRGVKFSSVPLFDLFAIHLPSDSITDLVFSIFAPINLLIGEKENVSVAICDSFIILDVIFQP